MKYYPIIAQAGIFVLDDVINITGNEYKAKKAILSMLKAGEIRRIKKNLYTAIDLSTLEDYSNRFVIGSHITDSSFISFHSAFEFYGFYNQVYYDNQISSLSKFYSFGYRGYEYKFYETKSLKQVITIQGVKVTTIERTIIDSINMLGKVMDVEELIKCVDLVHLVNEELFKEMLLEYDKDILYRKVGYFLSFFKKELSISDSFFDFCKEKSNVKNIGYLSFGETKKLEFVKEWGIYAYHDLKKLTNKGADIDV